MFRKHESRETIPYFETVKKCAEAFSSLLSLLKKEWKSKLKDREVSFDYQERIQSLEKFVLILSQLTQAPSETDVKRFIRDDSTALYNELKVIALMDTSFVAFRIKTAIDAVEKQLTQLKGLVPESVIATNTEKMQDRPPAAPVLPVSKPSPTPSADVSTTPLRAPIEHESDAETRKEIENLRNQNALLQSENRQLNAALRETRDGLLKAQQQNHIDSSHVHQQSIQIEQLTRANQELQNKAQHSAQVVNGARSREQGLLQTINTLTQELAEQKKRAQEAQETRTAPPTPSEVVEDQVATGILQSFAQNILEQLPTIGQGESSSIPESERDKGERVYKIITDIGRLLQSAWKNQPQRIENLEPILANSATIVGRKIESVRIPDNADQKQLLYYVVKQINKSIIKHKNPVTLENFAKGDIPVLAELFDKGKQGMTQQDIDAIERNLQELFPLVDLAEIRIKPYETAYNAHLHDLIKLSSAPSDKKVFPKSTIINSGSRGFTYKGQVHIKPKVIVAE